MFPRSLLRSQSAESPRCLPSTQIYEGTNQIQRLVIAKRLMA